MYQSTHVTETSQLPNQTKPSHHFLRQELEMIRRLRPDWPPGERRFVWFDGEQRRELMLMTIDGLAVQL